MLHHEDIKRILIDQTELDRHSIASAARQIMDGHEKTQRALAQERFKHREELKNLRILLVLMTISASLSVYFFCKVF